MASRPLPVVGVLREAGIREPYVLYLGRVDPNKGCDDLFRHFLDGGPSTDRDVQLVLAPVAEACGKE